MNFYKLSPIAFKLGEFEVRWYALFILAGALIAYFVSAHFVSKKGYTRDMCETIFVVGFLSGIIGARIWWCLSDASSPWQRGNFWGVITEFRFGGLAIHGGIMLGALAAILLVKFKFKTVKILDLVDGAVPNILIAQALGRWGNFMNQEVYGACVDYEKLNFLPGFIQRQMQGDMDIATGSVAGAEYYKNGSYINCYTNEAAIPLFLVESVLNIIGWVLITFILRKFWHRGRKTGDLGCLYLVWYGIVRLVLEPLRNSEFIMNSWGISVSVFTSILFIIAGILGMVALRVIPLIIKKKKGEAND